jgi:type IV fimbrial biogenesis protein FimT
MPDHMERLPTSTTPARGAEPGFTLIELLVTMVVAGILVAIAVPAFNNFVLNDRDIGQVNSLVGSLNYARSEAVKRASPTGVTVCPSGGGTTCVAGGTNWALGWIVLDPNNADCGGAPCAPLQSIPGMGGSNQLTGSVPGGITFSSNGLASAALTIRVCDTRGATFARSVEVNSTGRVAASQKQGKSVNGTALTCP